MENFTPPSPEELNELFPAHDILSFIAQGGMGAVYHANQISLDRPVAIKILPKEFGNDPDYRHSFQTEAKAMAVLNHINLVGVYDFGEIDNMLYIIMEYVPGRSLHEVAHNRTVNQIEAAQLIRDMCLGLEHAHKAGVIHRDIKPANVLINDAAQPKIVDFGLARPLDQNETSGVIFGTPGYTAPEVISHPLAVDQRSDIFSIGVMLYELLTGQLPDTDPIPSSSFKNGDKRLDQIIENSIHPDPSIRYRTAGEMAIALDDIINKPATAAQKSKAPSRIITATTATRPASSLSARSLTSLPSKKTSSSAPAVIAALIIVTTIISLIAINRDEPTPKQTQNSITNTPTAKNKPPLKSIHKTSPKKNQLQSRKHKIAERKKAEPQRELKQAIIARAELQEKKNQSTPVIARKEIPEAPQPAITTPTPEITRFDHVPFIEKLRSEVAQYASDNIIDYDKELTKNTDSFIRKTKRAHRKLHNAKRHKAEAATEAIFLEIISSKRIPAKTPPGGGLVKKVHADHLSNEKSIDEKYAHLITLWRKKYIGPCRAELEKLDKNLDKESFTFLTEEIKKSESNLLHTLSIARGQKILISKNR